MSTVGDEQQTFLPTHPQGGLHSILQKHMERWQGLLSKVVALCLLSLHMSKVKMKALLDIFVKLDPICDLLCMCRLHAVHDVLRQPVYFTADRNPRTLILSLYISARGLLTRFHYEQDILNFYEYMRCFFMYFIDYNTHENKEEQLLQCFDKK